MRLLLIAGEEAFMAELKLQHVFRIAPYAGDRADLTAGVSNPHWAGGQWRLLGKIVTWGSQQLFSSANV